MYLTVHRGNEPESLVDQCIRFLLHNVDRFSYQCHHDVNKFRNEDVKFPREISEKFLAMYEKSGGIVRDTFVDTFLTKDVTYMKCVKLRNADISDGGMQKLFKHHLQELELIKCANVTTASLEVLNECSDQLTSLSLGPSCHLYPTCIDSEVAAGDKHKLDYDFMMDDFEINISERDRANGTLTYKQRGYILKAPKLSRFSLIGHMFSSQSLCSQLYRDMPHLVHLNLSKCSFNFDNEDLSFLTEFKNTLVSLVLFNVSIVKDNLEHICSVPNLRRLDISTSNDNPDYGNYFPNPNNILSYIIFKLPHLVSLDISGTNLAGRGVAEVDPNAKGVPYIVGTDIPGLASRVDRPLDFLGLYGTKHGASHRHDIPALRVAGDYNEAQLLIAAKAYIDRPEMLQQVLNDLYHIFRYDTCVDIERALVVVLEALDTHLTERHIQISGSANLFYIVKMKDRPVLSSLTKRHIITTILNGMHMHLQDDTMMRNGCLTLCQFKIPQDVQFDYDRLVRILLHIITEMEHESNSNGSNFVLRIAIYLLNSLACQVDNAHKRLLGELGVIKKMLRLIKDRIEKQRCDDILEVAWSAMWNVTDETAINCARFLSNGGMELFLECLQYFPEKDELLRNMMGLLGNVAEVKSLRPKLMTSKFIELFANLVSSKSDGIEVSYNAAGVLSHIASDGPEAWTIRYPVRERVLAKMVEAIERWPIDSERNINYRSFEPIIQLLRVYNTPECQHWSVWALANLTKVYPEKYCQVVESEGGLPLLEELLENENVNLRIKSLARLVITNCEAQFKASK
uniref:Protein zer-1 homolog n=1 Tax=Cacopsylla melanoneura TaxID=428564 RepID=A0A8D8V687_9HEMI